MISLMVFVIYVSGSWEEIVTSIQKQREKEGLLKVFPEFICGEDLFGLSEATIQRMIESVSSFQQFSTMFFIDFLFIFSLLRISPLHMDIPETSIFMSRIHTYEFLF